MVGLQHIVTSMTRSRICHKNGLQPFQQDHPNLPWLEVEKEIIHLISGAQVWMIVVM